MKALKTLLDPFIFGMMIMLMLAWLVPFKIDIYSNYFPLNDVIYWGIFTVFFLYGSKLNLKKILIDIGNWKLHLAVQSATFILFPIVLLTVYPFVKDTIYYELWLASFFLAALPSTVSSSVVMVAMAKGNIPAAIVNASMSGIIGLFLTPLWMSFFLSQTESSIDFVHMLKKLFFQILLPVIIGLFTNRFLRLFIIKNAAIFSWIDKSIIFLIIYKSFSVAFLDGTFEKVSTPILFGLLAFALLLFIVIFLLLKIGSQSFGFEFNDQKTIILCGVQKSLVHASVFVTLIIPDISKQSLFLLPIMIYHSLQLFYTSYIAKQWGTITN